MTPSKIRKRGQVQIISKYMFFWRQSKDESNFGKEKLIYLSSFKDFFISCLQQYHQQINIMRLTNFYHELGRNILKPILKAYTKNKQIEGIQAKIIKKILRTTYSTKELLNTLIFQDQSVGKVLQNLNKKQQQSQKIAQSQFSEQQLSIARINIKQILREGYLSEIKKYEKGLRKKVEKWEKNKEKLFCFRVKLMLELSGYSNEFSEGIKEIKIREKESFKQWVKAKEKIEQRLEYFQSQILSPQKKESIEEHENEQGKQESQEKMWINVTHLLYTQ